MEYSIIYIRNINGISERSEIMSENIAFIFAHNEPSIRLFSGLGFEKWGYLPEIAELDGIRRDLMILGKKLYG